MFDERFEGTDLDPATWTPSYLPAWTRDGVDFLVDVLSVRRSDRSSAYLLQSSGSRSARTRL